MGASTNDAPGPTLRHYAKNDTSRGWREVSRRAGNGAADHDDATRTDARRVRKARTLIRKIMREQGVGRGDAVAMLQQEKRKHAAQRLRGRLPTEAHEKSADRQARKAIKSADGDASRAARVAAFLES